MGGEAGWKIWEAGRWTSAGWRQKNWAWSYIPATSFALPRLPGAQRTSTNALPAREIQDFVPYSEVPGHENLAVLLVVHIC